jgi:hypothetical protein
LAGWRRARPFGLCVLPIALTWIAWVEFNLPEVFGITD